LFQFGAMEVLLPPHPKDVTATTDVNAYSEIS